MSAKNVVTSEKTRVPIGSLQIDCTELSAFLVDLPPGELVGKRATQAGYDGAVLEIISNQEVWGTSIGIMPDEIARLLATDEKIEMIDAQLPAVRKLAEMLEETRALLDDARHRQVFEIAAVVDARSKGRRSSELPARYEKTCGYRSAAAMKGVRTRRRNKALAGAQASAKTTASSAPAPSAKTTASPAPDPTPRAAAPAARAKTQIDLPETRRASGPGAATGGGQTRRASTPGAATGGQTPRASTPRAQTPRVGFRVEPGGGPRPGRPGGGEQARHGPTAARTTGA